MKILGLPIEGGQKWAKFGQRSFWTTPKKKEEEEAEATTSAVRHQKTALGVILRPKNNRTKICIQ